MPRATAQGPGYMSLTVMVRIIRGFQSVIQKESTIRTGLQMEVNSSLFPVEGAMIGVAIYT
jgi:hypothetical protein